MGGPDFYSREEAGRDRENAFFSNQTHGEAPLFFLLFDLDVIFFKKRTNGVSLLGDGDKLLLNAEWAQRGATRIILAASPRLRNRNRAKYLRDGERQISPLMPAHAVLFQDFFVTWSCGRGTSIPTVHQRVKRSDRSRSGFSGGGRLAN